MASIQKVQKTASLLLEAPTTSPTPLSSGEEAVAMEAGLELVNYNNCWMHPFPCSVPELGEEGASGVRGPVLFHPPPNCRIREVHCGTQVRLVVIAIRDIAKGEEITVDYSLTDWGENAMVTYLFSSLFFFLRKYKPYSPCCRQKALARPFYCLW